MDEWTTYSGPYLTEGHGSYRYDVELVYQGRYKRIIAKARYARTAEARAIAEAKRRRVSFQPPRDIHGL